MPPSLAIPEINFSYWVLQTIAMMVTALLIPKLKVDGPLPALATVIALAFINAHIWSAALFFKVPDTLAMRSFTLLLTNGVIFWGVVKILPGIDVEGFIPALIAPLVFTFSSLLISEYGSSVDWYAVGKKGLHLMMDLKAYFESSAAPPPPVTAPRSWVPSLFGAFALV